MSKPRARDLGIPFSGTPGPLNAITDVVGIEVGHITLWSGEGRVEVGKGPVRTGVTAILPRGRKDPRKAFGGSFVLNAAGEMTGLAWLEERGLLEGPVMITNTHSVGTVRDATIQWMRANGWIFDWTVPVVGETYDGLFNDINGGHVRPEHVAQALDAARGGAVAEGCVGGGTGMMCYEYKGGIGTSSRKLAARDGGYTVGVLVQANYGRRPQLRVGGIPVGRSLTENMPCYTNLAWRPERAPISYGACGDKEAPDGSIIIVVATDAPLLPHQLRRLAKRPSLGIGRLGGTGANSSGDIFIAFSTANAEAAASADEPTQSCRVELLTNHGMSALFESTIDATEEAIVNAMVAAETSTGANGLRISALPHDAVRRLLAKHNLLVG